MSPKAPVGLCPICDYPQEKGDQRLSNGFRIQCERCGIFDISDTCLAILGRDGGSNRLLNTPEKIAAVGHWIRSRRSAESPPHVKSDVVEKLAKQPYFPDLHLQEENLIRLVGLTAGGPGEVITIDDHIDQFAVGCRKPSAVGALAKHLTERGILAGSENAYPSQDDGEAFDVGLTVTGWLEFEQLSRGKTSSRTAFMAMPFNKKDLDEAWLPGLRIAVAETGFSLKRVDDEPKPGLIDVRMRVQIQQARFLIVELTHANLGAYWEAGYAEGLGKPVIYTCREGVDPHFDVDHSLRIEWNTENMSVALDRIKATIRNALPDAAPPPPEPGA